VATGLRSARWLLVCSAWISTSTRPVNGRPLWRGLCYFLFVDGAGGMGENFVSGLTCASTAAEFGLDGLFSPIHVLGLGLSFCHCKNVRQVEQLADPPPRPQRNQPRVPRLRYYTLDIGPMRQVLRSLGRSDEVGIQRALHICRGNFATYTKDSPLFGKYAGTFWRPDHVKGNSTAGTVVKDYAVNPSGEATS
jgi:hypothetical protein